MTIDNTPAIRAWAEARIQHFETRLQKDPSHSATFGIYSRLDELQMLVTLCDGLTKQNQQKASEK